MSMFPAYRPGDLLLASRLRNGVMPPPGSDVVVDLSGEFRSLHQLPKGSNALKRVDHYRDGSRDEDVFLVGLAEGSVDSRTYGYVPRESMACVVIARLVSLGRRAGVS